MPKNPLLFLNHMLEAIEWINQDCAKMNFEQFAVNRQVRQLVERNLEIISEASRHISEVEKGKYPLIPWREIAGIGNVLRHDYHEVMPTILWAVLEDELPALKQAVESMIERLEG